MNVSVKSFLTRMLIITMTVVCVNLRACYALFVQGIKTTVIEVRVPFTVERSYGEFLGNFMIHMSMATYGTLAYVGLEIAMELLIGVVFIAPKLIEHEFQKLNKNISENRFTSMQSRFTFRNIVQQIMDVDKYELIFS